MPPWRLWWLRSSAARRRTIEEPGSRRSVPKAQQIGTRRSPPRRSARCPSRRARTVRHALSLETRFSPGLRPQHVRGGETRSRSRGTVAQSYELLPALGRDPAQGKGFGDVGAPELGDTVEVGDGAGDAEDPVVAAGGQVHALGRAQQQLAARGRRSG